MTRSLLLLLAALMTAAAQVPTVLSPSQQDPETQELVAALNQTGTSAIDMVRVLEAHLEKYPNTAHRTEIEVALAKASIDNKDEARTAKYGQKALEKTPDDVLLLDRVAAALLALGGKENTLKGIQYARTFEDLIAAMPPPEGKDVVQRQEERDRARGRTLAFQARGHLALDEFDEAARAASRSFEVYPNEESARIWAASLARMGKDAQAIPHLAEAFVIPDAHTTDAQRLEDRMRLGEMYGKLNGSETGLGDVILAAYDRSSTLVETRRKKLLALDPNSTMADPMEFTVTALDGRKLKLASLKGNVVILDFWATWCLPCRVQHPLYEQVKQRFKDRNDIRFLALDTDDDRSVVEPFLKEQNWDKTVYYDDGLARLLQVTSIPTTVIFDKQGRVASRMNGFLAETFADQLTDRVRALLQ